MTETTSLEKIMPILLCDFYECTDSHGNSFQDCRIVKKGFCEHVRLAEMIDENFILRSEAIEEQEIVARIKYLDNIITEDYLETWLDAKSYVESMTDIIKFNNTYFMQWYIQHELFIVIFTLERLMEK